MEPERLFVVPEPTRNEPHEACKYQALGIAAEYAAIGKLLEAGHKVAVPVTDDDGVDLIVNYRTTVQIKSSARRENGGRLRVGLQSWRARERPAEPKYVREHVDVYVIYARDSGEWWVIPRSEMPKGKSLTLHKIYDQWREAWYLLD